MDSGPLYLASVFSSLSVLCSGSLDSEGSMNGCGLYVVWILKLNPYLSLTQALFPGRKQLR